jgi:transposase
MAVRQILTAAQKKEIKTLYGQGINRTSIATKLGVKYATVCYWLPASHKRKAKKTNQTARPAGINWKQKYLDAVKILAENGLV